ncbi:GNAT family N-acetyltransferase [Fibrella aestuarina]|nr:GNAT family N-acetyltransferase [Fibrella aestuarina]
MLRPATSDDLPFVYESLCDLEETTLPYPAFERIYHANLSNSAVRYVLAEADNVPVGFASCHVQLLLHHAGPVAEIQELYVRPDYRSQGVGQQLIEWFMDEARQAGWVHLEVTSNRKRQRTHAFYERLGLVWTSHKFVWKPDSHFDEMGSTP